MFEHVCCTLVAKQDWQQLSQFIQDEFVLAEIESAVDNLSSTQKQLLELEADDLLFWPVANANQCPIIGQQNAEVTILNQIIK